jgi:hypothetical protein
MLTGTLTHCDVNLRKAVDYVPEYLINENFATIEKVIYHFYCQIREKDVMLAEMEKTKHYLKYGFDIGILNATPCVSHSVQFDLFLDPTVADAPLCACCQQIFFTASSEK